MSSVTAKIDLTPVQSDLATVLARLTASRAANLDASISSRASAAAVATVDSMADTIAGRLTAGRAANLDNLNTTITSRASQTSVNGKASQASVNAIPTSPIKSVQRGYTQVDGDKENVSVGAVNMQKAFIASSMETNDIGSASGWERTRSTVRLTSATNIRIERAGSSLGGQGPLVAWELIEYE